jgi:endonuclease/exonuclease/phosphatase family metal-dependent hydrolase
VTIRLVSHNAYWFQGHPYDGDQPGPPNPDVLRLLGTVYTQLEPDVLCIQEVHSLATAEALSEATGLPFLYLAGGRDTQYGVATFSPWRMSTLPVLSSPPAGAQGAVPSKDSGAPTLDRAILRVRLNPPDAPPLLVSNVHLPSDKQRGKEGGAARRLLEVPVAVEPDVASGDSIDVALGDFNEHPDEPCAQLFHSRGYVDAAHLAGQGNLTTNVKGNKRGDQIWVAPHRASTLLNYLALPLETLICSLAGKTHLSDHLPIGIDLQ